MRQYCSGTIIIIGLGHLRVFTKQKKDKLARFKQCLFKQRITLLSLATRNQFICHNLALPTLAVKYIELCFTRDFLNVIQKDANGQCNNNSEENPLSEINFSIANENYGK